MKAIIASESEQSELGESLEEPVELEYLKGLLLELTDPEAEPRRLRKEAQKSYWAAGSLLAR